MRTWRWTFDKRTWKWSKLDMREMRIKLVGDTTLISHRFNPEKYGGCVIWRK